MKFGEIHAFVKNVPFISEANARYLYDLILRDKLTNILELGIAHGTATCYMAAALDELGEGSITSVDLIGVKDIFKPSAEEQLEKTGLSQYVKVIRMQTGYTWFLHDEIARNTKDGICKEKYDLCIIDGPKNWTIDGAAFFFVDKLMKKNGWIIFDDYNWTYGLADTRRNITDGITHRNLSKDELETPQIRDVFELLVKQHPHYSNLILLADRDWALAQKTMNATKTYAINYRDTTKKDIVVHALRKIRSLFKR
jgi:predicted O-methyltransferase YrrM